MVSPSASTCGIGNLPWGNGGGGCSTRRRTSVPGPLPRGGRACVEPWRRFPCAHTDRAPARGRPPRRRPCRNQEHFGEIAERVALPVEQLGFFADRYRLASQVLCFEVLAAAREHLGPYLAPEHLRHDVVARAELRASGPPRLSASSSLSPSRAPVRGTRRARERPRSPDSSCGLTPSSANSAAVAGSSAQSSTQTEANAVTFASTNPPPRSLDSARTSARIVRASSKRPSIASAPAR